MFELYVFLASVLLITLIVGRRHFLIERFKKMTFKQKVAAKVDELKKEGQAASEKRFRESLTEAASAKKWDIVKYKNLMRQAEMAMAREEWTTAKSLLIQALAEAKDEFPVSMKLVKVCLVTGELRTAENLLTRLVEIAPDQALVFANLGKIHAQKKRYREAIAAYAKALELEEKNEEWLVALGKLYQLLMRPSLAAECFRRAAELKPRETSTLFLLAEACAADEDYDNALFTYDKILTIEPYNGKAQTALGETRMKMKELEITLTNLTSKQSHAFR